MSLLSELMEMEMEGEGKEIVLTKFQELKQNNKHTKSNLANALGMTVMALDKTGYGQTLIFKQEK